MYDRELQLETDREHIVATYGKAVFEKHRKVIADSKPKQLSITHPDGKERPKILAISSFASDFLVEDLREESGVSLRKEMSIMEAFKEWLNSLDRNDFNDSSAWNIIRFYHKFDKPKRFISGKLLLAG